MTAAGPDLPAASPPLAHGRPPHPAHLGRFLDDQPPIRWASVQNRGVPRIRVSTTVPASRRRVWAELADIGSHAEWMADAESITFTSRRRRGRGTSFDARTRLGPLAVTDRMEIVEWRPGRSMGVRHTGAVTGTGRFTLQRRLRGGTVVTWVEDLVFPWWLGGRAGARVGAPVLAWVWRRNLRALRRRVVQQR